MRRILATLVVAGVLTTGCAGQAPHRLAARPAVGPTVAPSQASPPPLSAQPPLPRCPAPMGATLALHDARSGAALRLTVAHPSWSRTSLSRDYGSPPRNGWYLTVQVRLVATGQQPVTIGPEDFYVRDVSRARTTTDDGNAEESGATQALGTTVADPGETVTGPLTFDLSDRHGLVAYAPSLAIACSWRF